MNILVIFPLFTFVSTAYLMLSCYIQGLVWKHFNPLFPVVSQSGRHIPEAATFTFVVIISSVMFLITSSIRFIQLQAIINDARFVSTLHTYYLKHSVDAIIINIATELARFNRLNRLLYVSSVIMCSSLIFIGTFRTSETQKWHDICTTIAFLNAPVIMCLNVYLSRVLIGSINTAKMYNLRLCLCVLALVCLVLYIIHRIFALIQQAHKSFPFWSRHQPGLIFLAMIEWIYLLSSTLFVATFMQDFSRLIFVELTIEYAFCETLDCVA